MRFKTLFNVLFFLAISSDVADFVLTMMGFTRFIVFWEINPYVLFLMRYFKPYAAGLIIFTLTLILVVIGYTLAKEYLNQYPYSESLREVGGYLWNTESVKGRDLLVFSFIALFSYFTYIHLMGTLSWLMLFLKL